MFKKLAIIKCMETLNDIPYNFPLFKYLPIKYIHKILRNKVPYQIDSTAVLDKEIVEIYLPIITSINQLKSEDYIKTVIDHFNSKALKENISVAVLSKELMPYKAYFDMLIADEKEVQYLYVDKIIEQLVTHLPLDKKSIHYAVIDDEEQKAHYVLEYLQNVNHLTIMTSNQEAYQNSIEAIYDHTGLAIQMADKSVNQQIDSDIIVNCCKKRDKMFYCFKEGAIIIDVMSDKEKIFDILSKRDTLKVINRVDVYYQQQLISPSLLHGLLLYENRFIRNMYSYGYKAKMKDKIAKIKESYPIEIGSLYQINERIIESS